MSATLPGEPRNSLPSQPDRHGVRDDFATRSRLPHVCCCVRRWLTWTRPSPLLSKNQHVVLTSSEVKRVVVASIAATRGSHFVPSSGRLNLVAAMPHLFSPAGATSSETREWHCHCANTVQNACEFGDQTTSFLFPAPTKTLGSDLKYRTAHFPYFAV
jgi:hypothetical protein